MRLVLLISVLAVTGFPGQAKEPSHSHTSKYAGQESRAIKSLSPDDIAELRRGGGWGMAKAAELNGIPGPVHLLELKDNIPLRETQVSEIKEIYGKMKHAAIQQGEKLIALEKELETQFRNGSITRASLSKMLQAISETRMKLRFIHLSTHLRTPEILTAAQIARYNSLRGYDKPDPCINVPLGHDANMWRKHNGCE